MSKSSFCRSSMCAGLIGFSMIFSLCFGMSLQAQASTTEGGSISSDTGTKPPKIFQLKEMPITVTPNRVIVDPVKHTAVVTITNTFDESIILATSLQFGRPVSKSEGPVARGLIASDSNLADSLARVKSHTDSLAALWSLEPWVKRLSPRIELAPHQTVTLTIPLNVPAALKAGEYSCYVVFHQLVVFGVSSDVSFGGGNGADAQLRTGGANKNKVAADGIVAYGTLNVPPVSVRLVYQQQ